MTHQFKDPLKGLGDERLAIIVKDYLNPDLSISDIALRHSIGKDRVAAIAKAKGLRLRDRNSHIAMNRAKRKRKRTIAQVFMGIETPKPVEDPLLEAAKTALRQRGCIVYDATVTDGARAKGLIKVDGMRLTRAQVVAMATQRRAA